MPIDLTGFEPVISTNVAPNFEDYVPVGAPKKPKGPLESIRELLSPITGPTPTQLEENPPTVPVSPDAGYLDRVRSAQGLLPKVFTSPLNLPSLPQQPDVEGNIFKQAAAKINQFNSGLYNVAAKGIIEPLLSPGGVATLGAGAATRIPGIVGRGADLGLKALSGILAPQAAGTVIEGTQAPTLQQKIEKIVGGGLLGIGAYKGLKGIGPREVSKPSEVPVAKPNLEYVPELNEPLPTPWIATDEKGRFLVKDSIVKAKFDEVVKTQGNENVPTKVKREFLQQQQTEVGSDTPNFAAQEKLSPLQINQASEISEAAKTPNRPEEVLARPPSNLEVAKGLPKYSSYSEIPVLAKLGQPPVEPYFKQPTPLSTAKEVAENKAGVSYPLPGEGEFLSKMELSTALNRPLTDVEYARLRLEFPKTKEPLRIKDKPAYIGEKQGVELPKNIQLPDRPGPTGEELGSIPVPKEPVKPTAPLETTTHPLDGIKPEDIIPIEKEPITKEEPYAPQSESTNLGEHPGVPPRKNLPADIKEIRQEESGQTSSSGSLLSSEGKGELSESKTLPIEQGGYRPDEPYTVKKAGGRNIGKWEIPYIGQFKTKVEADAVASKLNEAKVSPKEAYEAAKKGVSEVLKLTEPKVEGGLNIKLGNPSELGGLDLSVIHDFARGLYDNTKDFAKWSVEMLKKFPSLAQEHLKQIWTNLRASKLDAPLLTTPITKLSQEGPKGSVVADAAINTYENYRENKGKYIETPIRALKTLIGLKTPKDILNNNSDSARRVLKYMDEVSDNGSSSIKLTAPEQQAVDVIKKTNTLVRDEQNSRPGMRQGGYNPDYLQQSFDRGALHYITNEPESPKAKQYEKDFLDYRVNKKGQTPQEAQKDWDIIKKGFSKQFSNAAEQFGPLDKAAGLGIPPSMRSQNLFDRIKNYGDRVARRFAYHDNFEANPTAQDALKDYSASENWKRIFRDISGQRELTETKRNAVMGLAKAGMTGTLTGVRNLIQGQYLGWDQFTGKQIAVTTAKGWLDFKKNWERTFSQGINRENIASIEFGEGGLKDSIRTINRIRDITNSLMGKNLLEKTARTVNMGMGRINTIENFSAALNKTASPTQLRWLDNYGKTENWKQYLTKGSLPDEVIDRMAAKFVESVQGTYDYRTLPSWAVEGSVAPFFSLSRWSIDRTNRFTKNVVSPLVNGDIAPALKATLGMIVGGTVIDQITQAASKRRNPVPTLGEIQAGKEQGTDEKGILLYKLASLSSISSMMGFHGDLFKTVMDKWYGNRSTEFNNPALELVKNLGERTFDVVQAHAEGDLNLSDVPNIISQVLQDNAQNWRIALAQFSKDQQEEISRSNAFKERRVFRQVTGRGVQTLGGEDTSNPFLNKDIREYKRTGDINRAAELLPKVAQNILSKNKNDPEATIRSLESLKQNSYATFPSPEDSPLEFGKYLQYLDKTKGVEERNRMLMDYLKQEEVNKIKAKMIP